MHSLKQLNITKLSLSLPSEIFCIKAVIVACLYAVSNLGSVHTYKQREQATINVVRQNISL